MTVYVPGRFRAMTLPPRNRKMTLLYIGLGLVAAVVLAVLAILLTHVEDWSRDLTINFAATSDDAKDARLQPIRSHLSSQELAKLVIAAAAKIHRWELAERQAGPPLVLHFVRTTGLMRYKDDIHVRIEPANGGTLLTAESRSRIGKGDLGQNPRNLRELLGAVRAALP